MSSDIEKTENLCGCAEGSDVTNFGGLAVEFCTVKAPEIGGREGHVRIPTMMRSLERNLQVTDFVSVARMAAGMD